MTEQVFRTIVVTAADVDAARDICAEFEGGDGMFTTPLSPTGQAPVTNYVSSGYIDAGMAEQVKTQLPASDVSEEEPFVAFERLGLQMVYADE